MAIGGQKRTERGEFQKVTGLFEAKVLAFNPTKQELETILGTELEKEPEYLVPEYKLTDKDGGLIDTVRRAYVSVWLQDVKGENGGKYNLRFILTDYPRHNKDNTKTQYINRHGISSWAPDTQGIAAFDEGKYDWFREPGGLRVAHMGEDNFYEFLRAWLLIDFKNDPEAELTLDWNRLIEGDMRELNDALSSDLAGTVLCLATVRTADTDNGPQDFQGVYNGAFLPGSYIRSFRMKGRKLPKALEKFIQNITDPEYGCKDYFVMEELKAYNPEDNVAHSEAALIEGQGGEDVASEADPFPTDLTY
jgi:hypothetical protein